MQIAELKPRGSDESEFCLPPNAGNAPHRMSKKVEEHWAEKPPKWLLL